MLFTASPAYTQKCSQETKLSLPAPEILLAVAETVLCAQYAGKGRLMAAVVLLQPRVII